MCNIKHDEQYWIAQYEEQKPFIEHSFPNEEFKQCLDKESWNAQYYNPVWLVSSEGRVYSLARKRLLNPYLTGMGKRDKDGNYKQYRYYLRNDNEEAVKRAGNSGLQTKVFLHRLVANYFCDKTVIDLYGEENVTVHHLFHYDTTNTDYVWLNRAAHIQYITKMDHQLLNALQKGLKKTKYKGKTYELAEDDPLIDLMVDNARFQYQGVYLDNGISIEYDSTGAATIKQVIPISSGNRVYL